MFASVAQPYVQHQPVFGGAENQMIGAARRTFGLEPILFQKVADRDFPLLRDFG